MQLRVGRPAPEDAPGVAGPRGVGQGRGGRLPAGAAGGLEKGKHFEFRGKFGYERSDSNVLRNA